MCITSISMTLMKGRCLISTPCVSHLQTSEGIYDVMKIKNLTSPWKSHPGQLLCLTGGFLLILITNEFRNQMKKKQPLLYSIINYMYSCIRSGDSSKHKTTDYFNDIFSTFYVIVELF